MLQLASKVGNVTFDNQHPAVGDSREALLAGLQAPRKHIDPKFFYDARGSALFGEITALPEYYPTRTERGILTKHADEIAACCGRACVLIEPGSGSSEKVRLLLEALRPSAYVPVDISANFLHDAALRLGQEYPSLRVHAICADFAEQWQLPAGLPTGRRVVFYPGSTIGNLEPQAAVGFLQHMRTWIGAQGGLLIGVDLHKSERVLHAAYNDARGVTARFNLNVLNQVNRILGTDFAAADFEHRAFFNRELGRIEMHLVSQRDQRSAGPDHVIELSAGETIHTENSYKYTVERFGQLTQRAGLTIRSSWYDAAKLFSVHYLTPE